MPGNLRADLVEAIDWRAEPDAYRGGLRETLPESRFRYFVEGIGRHSSSRITRAGSLRIRRG